MKVVVTRVTSSERAEEAALDDTSGLSDEEVCLRAIALHRSIMQFWRDNADWPPLEASQLIAKSRLDWQQSLADSLKLWATRNTPLSDGELILAYANLGALVEGIMKLFLSVWYEQYKVDVEALRRAGKLHEPDLLCLEALRNFFRKKVWGDRWDSWVADVQKKRNSIHAYQDRNLGTSELFLQDLRQFLRFLRYMNERFPYPYEEFRPDERDRELSAT